MISASEKKNVDDIYCIFCKLQAFCRGASMILSFDSISVTEEVSLTTCDIFIDQA